MFFSKLKRGLSWLIQLGRQLLTIKTNLYKNSGRLSYSKPSFSMLPKGQLLWFNLIIIHHKWHLVVCFRNKIYVYTLPVVDICKLIYLPYPMILQVPGANCQFPPDMNYLFCLLCFQLVDCDKTIILYFFYKSGITESFLLNFFIYCFFFSSFFFLLFKLNFSEVVFYWILTKRMWHLCKGWVLVCDNFSLVRSPQNQTATNMQGSKSSSASQSKSAMFAGFFVRLTNLICLGCTCISIVFVIQNTV